MDIETARFLVSPAGRECLAGATDAVGGLSPDQLVNWFRQRYPPALAAALSFQVELQAKAAGRMGQGHGLLLTPDGLEAMTHPVVARRRAQRVAGLGLRAVDLTCGLGGDLRAMAEVSPGAAGLERDPATAMLASANVPAASIVRGEAAAAPFRLDGSFVFIDPSRRAGSQRTFNAEGSSPPLSVAMELVRAGTAGCIKAAPGLPRHLVPPEAEFEVIQLGRSLREAALWFGGDARPGLRRAVRLPTGAEIDSSGPECDPAPVRFGRYLADPHSCVTRAGLVTHLGARMGARLVDEHLGYLAVDEPVDDPLAEVFEVLEVVPFAVKSLRGLLRVRGWRAREVRRRAFPVEPGELLRLLGPPPPGGTGVTLFLTTVAGRRLVVIGQPWLP